MAFDIDFLESYDLESIAVELRRVAGVVGKRTLSRGDIDRYGRLNSRTVMLKFGTLRKAHEAAGLVPSRYTKSTDAELLKILRELWTITLEKSGRSPRTNEVREFGFPVSARTIVSRFGSWNKALIAAASAMPDETKNVAPEKVKPKRTAISTRKRFFVFKRDLYRCRICRDAGVKLAVDHIVPVSLGGSNALDNLQTLCIPCNEGKRDSLQ